MKPSEYFSSHYRLLNKKFEATLGHTLRLHAPEHIHELRVTIKKMKAFFRLLEYVNGEFDAAKSFHYYKKIFKKAGKVRDRDVQLQLLRKLEGQLKISLPQQRNEIMEDRRKQYTAFRNYYGKVSPAFHSRVKKNVLKIVKKEFPAKRSAKYLLQQQGQISAPISRPVKDDHALHRIRILLKDYIYNLALVNDCMHKNKIIRKHTAGLSRLQAAIGIWHDGVTMLSFINQYRESKAFSKPEIKTMLLLRKRLQQSGQQQAQGIRRSFPKMMADFKTLKELL